MNRAFRRNSAINFLKIPGNDFVPVTTKETIDQILSEPAPIVRFDAFLKAFPTWLEDEPVAAYQWLEAHRERLGVFTMRELFRKIASSSLDISPEILFSMTKWLGEERESIGGWPSVMGANWARSGIDEALAKLKIGQ